MTAIEAVDSPLPPDISTLVELEIKQSCPVDRAYQLVDDYPNLARLKIAGTIHTRQEIKQLPFGQMIGGMRHGAIPVPMPPPPPQTPQLDLNQFITDMYNIQRERRAQTHERTATEIMAENPIPPEWGLPTGPGHGTTAFTTPTGGGITPAGGNQP